MTHKIYVLAFLFFAQFVRPNDPEISVRFKTYDHEFYNTVVQQLDIPLSEFTGEITFNGAIWRLEKTSEPVKGKTGVEAMGFKVICVSGKNDRSSVSIVYHFTDWKNENYVLVPGALYNGNKYEYRRIRYSPKLMNPKDIGADVPIILTDVPRLNKNYGPSEVQFRASAATAPSISFYDHGAKDGFLMFVPHRNSFGDYGMGIRESRDKGKVEFSVTSPVVREKYRYTNCETMAPSEDMPADFKEGDAIDFTIHAKAFSSEKLQGLFDEFITMRKSFSEDDDYNRVFSFSEAFRVQEEKFNRDNWVDVGADGYYSVGMRNNFMQDWQIGWVGGMMTTFPLLFDGGATTREHVIKNFNWLFPNGVSDSGFFYGFAEGGTNFFGGDRRNPHTKDWHLTRKSADAIFYIMVQFELMRKMNIPIDPEWENGLKKACDAFVKVWDENKQIGQFVDINTGEIQVGGSSSAAILPAGLVYAAAYFKKPEYLEAAKGIADYFYTNFTEKGISCGGPGDAMQNFDSESAYGLVEGYYALYEATGDKKWETAAAEAAKQFSTWVISYNYTFPENSLFGRLNVNSLGGVLANTQNTHGSPGICTHSGLALLKLTRSTGDPFYANLLKDITHAMPQLLSHPDRKILDAKDGWMSERLSTTDWNEGIGEIFVGSTWAETALLMTYAQIPGIYVCAETSEVYCFDNVLTEVVSDSSKKLKVKVTNPSQRDAKVKIWEESAQKRTENIDNTYLHGVREVKVKAGKSVVLTFKK